MMKELLRIVVMSFVAFSIIGCPDTDGNGEDDETAICEYENAAYYPGDSFPCSDGCNTCTCESDGSVSATEMDCEGGITCEYDGEIYNAGDQLEDEDGCNRCWCMANGSVECDDMGCEEPICEYSGVAYYVSDSFPCSDGCNTCTCESDGSVSATEMDCEGEDACVNSDDARPTIFLVGVSYGGCLGECNYDITFGEATGDSCMTATLNVCDNGVDATCSRENTGTLTPRGHAKVTGLAEELQGVTLEDVYGCPGCADGGIGALTVTFDDSNKTSLTYEYEAPPEVLKSVHAFTQGLIEALNTCTPNDDIVIGKSDCTTKGVH